MVEWKESCGMAQLGVACKLLKNQHSSMLFCSGFTNFHLI